MLDAVRPDVITLDIQMPRMDGLATLDAILAQTPYPGDHGQFADQVGGGNHARRPRSRGRGLPGKTRLRGKDPGRSAGRIAAQDPHGRRLRRAADPGNPPRADSTRIAERAAHRGQVRRGKPRPAERHGRCPSEPAGALPIASPAELAGKCVAIGISTGGPPALAQLFAAIRPPMPPIVVVQHMPPNFTKPLAWRLDSLSELSIKEAAVGDVLEPNQVLIAPGGKHLQVRRAGRRGEGRDPRRAASSAATSPRST